MKRIWPLVADHLCSVFCLTSAIAQLLKLSFHLEKVWYVFFFHQKLTTEVGSQILIASLHMEQVEYTLGFYVQVLLTTIVLLLWVFVHPRRLWLCTTHLDGLGRNTYASRWESLFDCSYLCIFSLQPGGSFLQHSVRIFYIGCNCKNRSLFIWACLQVHASTLYQWKFWWAWWRWVTGFKCCIGGHWWGRQFDPISACPSSEVSIPITQVVCRWQWCECCWQQSATVSPRVLSCGSSIGLYNIPNSQSIIIIYYYQSPLCVSQPVPLFVNPSHFTKKTHWDGLVSLVLLHGLLMQI